MRTCAIVFAAMFSKRTDWQLSTNRFTQTLEELRGAGVVLIDLTVSNPTKCELQYNAQAMLAAFQNYEALSYDPQPKGLLDARKEVARYYAEDHQIAVDLEEIFLTTSTSEAYSFVFRLLCNPEDEVVVPKPSYPLFDFLADLQDVSLIPYALEYAQGWMVDFHSLERAITSRTRAILLVHPNNPTGSYLRAEEVARLNAICRERGLALIVDEVFLDFAFEGSKRGSFTANREALTFTLSGLSKISALPQMKMAWLVCTGPEQLVAEATERLEVIADTYLSLNAPVQWAMPTLLEQRKAVQTQMMSRIQKNRAELRRQFAAQKACELLEGEGGWYAVIRMPPAQSDEQRAVALMREQHVIVHPGHFFDFPKDGFLVLSLITPAAEFAEGVERMLSSMNPVLHR